MTKTLKNDIGKYTIVLPRKKKVLNVRDYIIPTKWKKKRNISGNIDKFLYGAK